VPPVPEAPAQPTASSPQQIAVAAPAPVATQGEAQPKPKATAESFTGEKVTAWRWPTAGPVIRGYSESVHKGIDIGGARGDAVSAVASGKVVYAGTGIAGFGELLIIKHNDVYLSAYGHNDELLVAEGDTVVAGQAIAQKGSSGTDAVKLHFEIRQEGKPIDPLRLLPGR
jgi:lipoprotein NlpD